MKDDTISRTAALKGLEDLNIVSFYEENEHSKEAYTEVKAMLKALPSAQPVEDIHREKEQAYYCGYEDGAKAARSAQPGWIPCSERLPDNNRQVLVYARSVHFVLAKYDEMREADGTYKMQWVTFDAWKPFYKIKEVIAWMPLPEPWKGEQDGN